MTESSLWIWGRHSVLEALRAGTVQTVLVASGRRASPILDEIRHVAGVRGVPLREVPPAEVDRLAPDQNTQGVAARVVERRLGSVAELLDTVAQTVTPAFLLALDQVQDPHNLGALVRTANAAGVNGVILPERHSAHVSGVVAKSSAGAVSHLPLVEVTNLARTLDHLRETGIWVAGLTDDAAQTIYETDLTMPVALVVGSEGHGLRRLVRERCDFLIRLPMVGQIQSLNASVAGSIAMYEVLRQRLASGSSR